MSSEDKTTCPSRAYVSDELVSCRLDPSHDGVHLGPLKHADHADELVQWRDADALDDSEGVDGKLPLWYGVLPLGAEVRVGYRDDRERMTGQLVGAVAPDDALDALVVEFVENRKTRRALIPWGNVAVLSWEVEQ